MRPESWIPLVDIHKKLCLVLYSLSQRYMILLCSHCQQTFSNSPCQHRESFSLLYPSWITVFHIHRLAMKIKVTLHFTNISVLQFITVIVVLLHRHLPSGNVHPSKFLSPLLWLSFSLCYLGLLKWLLYFSFLHSLTLLCSFHLVSKW